MENVTAIIERASDGGYSVYIVEDLDGFVATGFGDTPEEAKEDLLTAIEELCEDMGDKAPKLNITFKYDVASFLRAYQDKLSFSGLEVITGVNRKQLQHYVSGFRNPSPKTVKKIEQGVHDFAAKLKDLQFA